MRVRLEPGASTAAAACIAGAWLLGIGAWGAAVRAAAPPGEPASWPTLSEEEVRRLAETTPPDAATVGQLLEQIEQSDAIVREAALRRLRPHPAAAATPVVETFAAGNLTARIAMLELLHAWDAPTDGLDPWDAATVTDARLAALHEWAAAQSAAPTTRPTTLRARDAEIAAAEVDRMLEARTDAEVRVVRERLARHGEALLPAVYERLASVAADEERRRLVALRYRLVATHRLALTWPDGLERLASPDARDRHAAIDELAARASADDQRLLLELFADPDGLIRERSLQLLHSVGGAGTSAALVRLLHDPDPNVRAAVLKQLAEKPPAELVGHLVSYASTETTPDLVVHAVRIFRGMQGQAAVDALKGLLAHESWRVRAEAVDAIHEVAGRSPPASRERAGAYAAVITLLDDPDAFVVGRAVAALSAANVAAALEPMARAAETHPQLAADVVAAMTNDRSQAVAALPHLRRFCGHADPSVRAAAIGGLCALAPRSAADELRTALGDSDSRVRTAAATALLDTLGRLRPDADASASGDVSSFSWTSLLSGGRAAAEPKVPDVDAWLNDFRAGKNRPEWVNRLLTHVEPLLSAESADERMAGAIPLIAMGRDIVAVPVVVEAAEREPRLRSQAAAALRWLPWEPRAALFDRLVKLGLSEDQVVAAIDALVSSRDERAAGLVWDLLADYAASVATFEAVLSGLRQLYFGERYYDPSGAPAAARKAATASAEARVTAGSEWQRSAALALLAGVAPDAAAGHAQNILDDPQVGEWLRLDALQVLLVSDPKTAERTAVRYVADPVLRKIAVPYLSAGSSAIQQLRGRVYLYLSNEFMQSSMVIGGGGGAPIEVKPPEGLATEPLRELLKGDDAELAAHAGYLLALSGDRAGYERLVAHWRSHQPGDDTWGRLVYRAIAAMNDDALVPVLEEIYRGFDKHDYAIREFYWTIRGIKGPNALRLRKQVRDEVGMDRLR